MKMIKVLIIEDSKLMQQVLTQMLSSDPQIKVIGTASEPFMAREMIKRLNPDVVTLDIMLPYMDGITFLKNLMRLHPMPVVMISALTEAGSSVALEALALGAVAYMHKPTQKGLQNFSKYAEQLIHTIKSAAKANVVKKTSIITDDPKLRTILYQSDFLRRNVIAIGASTGGIEAIEDILAHLPKVLPPILLVQHMKKEFSSAFPKRIKKLYGLKVLEAEDLTEILPGHIYIAPGGMHLMIRQRNNRYFTKISDEKPANGHKPSVDKLFESVANIVGSKSIGILLTGMGTDGALGLKAILDAGGTTIAQDEESSVVWGMPGAAVNLNAAEYVLPLEKIHNKILEILDERALQWSNKA